MPIFEIQGKDGKIYEADAPSMEAVAKALGLNAPVDMPASRIEGAHADAEGAKRQVGAGEAAFLGLGSGGASNWGEEIGAALDLPVTAIFDGSLGEKYRRNYAIRHARNENAREQQPGAFLAGEVGGMLLTAPVAIGKAAQGANLLQRAHRIGKAGAVGAAVYAGGEDGSASERAIGAASALPSGYALGASLPVIGAGVKRTARAFTRRTGRQAAHTVEQLRTTKDAAYKRVDESGIRYSAREYDDMLQKIADDLKANEFDFQRHKNAAAVARRLWARRGTDKSLSRLDKFRQSVRRDVVDGPDKAEQFFGMKMMARLDELMDSKASGVIKEARAANTTWRKAEMIEKAIKQAERNAAKSGTGGNIDNTLRIKMGGLLDAKAGLSLTAEEREIIDRFVRGGRTRVSWRNTMRLLGRLSPEGNGLMLFLNVLGIGGASALGMTGPMLAVTGAGFTAKRLADAAARRGARGIQDYVAAGGKQLPNLPPPPGQIMSERALLRGAIPMLPSPPLPMVEPYPVTSGVAGQRR